MDDGKQNLKPHHNISHDRVIIEMAKERLVLHLDCVGQTDPRRQSSTAETIAAATSP